MTVAKRIIPCLDVDNGKVVKGRHFVELREAGEPVELATRYRDEGADELVFLDITATVESRNTLYDVVRNVAEVLDIPFTVGGGIRSIEDAYKILRNGADKISINTMAVEKPEIIKELSIKYGAQCVVVAIDAKRTYRTKSGFEVYTHGARVPRNIDALEWAKRVEELGAGEILLTSIDRDGTKEGYDLELTSLISSNVNIPVIASGGGGTLEHIYEALTLGKADAALAASIFHYKEYTIREVKEYLKRRGVMVRL
ncbi:MAG: imidazole glycerol phosphate synthase subunit HisF [Nitrososphaeria archaeon]|nr:imidazole glycerol phosphate synthase subunit HisF [Nitrososphaeria archaeon]